MNKKPLSGQITPPEPPNPIQNLALAIRKFKPVLVNENWEGAFEDRDPKDPGPTRDQLINTAGEAMTMMHGVIQKLKEAQKDNVQIVMNMRNLTEDYKQLADIINHFIHITPNDEEAIKGAQKAASQYIARFKQTPGNGKGVNPGLKVLDPTSKETGGENPVSGDSSQ